MKQEYIESMKKIEAELGERNLLSEEQRQTVEWVGMVQSIEEPEFGCEGRPEGKTAQAKVSILNVKTDNIVTESMTETLLYQSHLDDGVWIFKTEDEWYLYDQIRTQMFPLLPEVREWMIELLK